MCWVGEVSMRQERKEKRPKQGLPKLAHRPNICWEKNRHGIRESFLCSDRRGTQNETGDSKWTRKDRCGLKVLQVSQLAGTGMKERWVGEVSMRQERREKPSRQGLLKLAHWPKTGLKNTEVESNRVFCIVTGGDFKTGYSKWPRQDRCLGLAMLLTN